MSRAAAHLVTYNSSSRLQAALKSLPLSLTLASIHSPIALPFPTHTHLSFAPPSHTVFNHRPRHALDVVPTHVWPTIHNTGCVHKFSERAPEAHTDTALLCPPASPRARLARLRSRTPSRATTAHPDSALPRGNTLPPRCTTRTGTLRGRDQIRALAAESCRQTPDMRAVPTPNSSVAYPSVVDTHTRFTVSGESVFGVAHTVHELELRPSEPTPRCTTARNERSTAASRRVRRVSGTLRVSGVVVPAPRAESRLELAQRARRRARRAQAPEIRVHDVVSSAQGEHRAASFHTPVAVRAVHRCRFRNLAPCTARRGMPLGQCAFPSCSAFSPAARTRATQGTHKSSRVVRMLWNDRSGSTSTANNITLDTGSIIPIGSQHTATWYFLQPLPVVRVFWRLEHPLRHGRKLEDQQGKGFAVKDDLVFANSSCSAPAEGKRTFNVALSLRCVRNDVAPTRAHLEQTSRDITSRPIIVEIDMTPKPVDSNKAYVIWSANVSSTFESYTNGAEVGGVMSLNQFGDATSRTYLPVQDAMRSKEHHKSQVGGNSCVSPLATKASMTFTFDQEVANTSSDLQSRRALRNALSSLPTLALLVRRERQARYPGTWRGALKDIKVMMCLSSDPPLFFIIFASFMVFFAVVFFAVWIYAVVRGCRQGALREEKPPAYVLLPSAGHDAELDFDFAEEREGDVKARHVQALA
ncbi:hypothetical protein B0H14DRAFT_3486713 [Mycena olivaceomarginata]|nr:hypothetical protein B0H14DRAFT_3486713 [Mycena olivaceomarginata]